MKSPEMQIRRVRAAWPPLVMLKIWSLIDSICRAAFTTSCPRSVRVTPGALLSSNSNPSRNCSRLICALTAGWVTPKRLGGLGEAAQVDDRYQCAQKVGWNIHHAALTVCLGDDERVIVWP